MAPDPLDLVQAARDVLMFGWGCACGDTQAECLECRAGNKLRAAGLVPDGDYAVQAWQRANREVRDGKAPA